MRLLLLLAFLPAAALATARYSDGEANLRLATHLLTLSEEARSERRVRAVLNLSLGVAGGVGYFAARDSSDPDVRNTLAPVLAVSGAVFLLGGVLALASPSEYETLPPRFTKMPKDTPEQLRAKVVAGEDILRRLAEKSRRERLWGGGTLLALGTGQLVWYLASDRTTTNRDFLVYGGISSLGFGALTLLLTRTPEQELEAYRDWTKGRTAALRPEVGWGPMSLSLLWRF